MDNLNSVCFVSKINEIKPIVGADRIESVQVEGWNAISGKGIHKVGDLVICITTDAVVPTSLAEKWDVIKYLRSGNRVRTIKLKQVYSECLLISIKETFGDRKFKEGQDLQDLLKIYKYEAPAVIEQVHRKLTWLEKLFGIKLKNRWGQKQNPNFPIYYKFPNRKNAPNIFNEQDDIIITRKLHGTNFRSGIVKKPHLSIKDRIKKLFGDKWIEYEFVYGSHNVQKPIGQENTWSKIASELCIKDKLWNLARAFNPKYLGSGIVIYGEIFGSTIQGANYNYGLNKPTLKLFDIQINGIYRSNLDFTNYCGKYGLDLDTVEILYSGKWSQAIQDEYSKSVLIEGTSTYHEGIIVRTVDGDRHKIYKIISNEYTMQSEKNGNLDLH